MGIPKWSDWYKVGKFASKINYFLSFRLWMIIFLKKYWDIILFPLTLGEMLFNILDNELGVVKCTKHNMGLNKRQIVINKHWMF